MMAPMYPCGVCGGVIYAEARRRKVPQSRRPQGEAGQRQVVEVGDRVAAVANWATRVCKGVSVLRPLAGHGRS